MTDNVDDEWQEFLDNEGDSSGDEDGDVVKVFEWRFIVRYVSIFKNS